MHNGWKLAFLKEISYLHYGAMKKTSNSCEESVDNTENSCEANCEFVAVEFFQDRDK